MYDPCVGEDWAGVSSSRSLSGLVWARVSSRGENGSGARVSPTASISETAWTVESSSVEIDAEADVVFEEERMGSASSARAGNRDGVGVTSTNKVQSESSSAQS